MTSTTETAAQTNSTSPPATTTTTTGTPTSPTTTPSTTLQNNSTTANATDATGTNMSLTIGISVGGFFLIVIVIAAALFLCRKRRSRRRQSPPSLPALNAYGLPHSIDSHDSLGSGHTWNGSRTELLPPMLPPQSRLSINYEDPNKRQPTHIMVREDSSSNSTYVNTHSQGPGSSAGSYVIPLEEVPDDFLIEAAKEASHKMSKRTHPKARIEESQGTFEPHYMEMDPMKNRDSELTESFESSENMYMPPDITLTPELPPPCSHGMGLSAGYVNVPVDKKQADLQTQQSGEYYENLDNHQYRNVSPDLIISSDHSPSAKSLNQMATPEKVRKTLKEGSKQSPALTQQKVPPAKAIKPARKAAKPVLSHSAKTRHYPTHHDQSHLHEHSSSLPDLPVPACHRLPEASQTSSDSDDERQESYENVPENTGPKAHSRDYVNAPDKKTEPGHTRTNAKAATGAENGALEMSPRKPSNNGSGPTKADNKKIKKIVANPQGLTAATVNEELMKTLALKKKHIDKVS